MERRSSAVTPRGCSPPSEMDEPAGPRGFCSDDAAEVAPRAMPCSACSDSCGGASRSPDESRPSEPPAALEPAAERHAPRTEPSSGTASSLDALDVRSDGRRPFMEARLDLMRPEPLDETCDEVDTAERPRPNEPCVRRGAAARVALSRRMPCEYDESNCLSCAREGSIPRRGSSSG
eukprot:5476803-Prymnesium_polylepis.1